MTFIKEVCALRMTLNELYTRYLHFRLSAKKASNSERRLLV